MKVRHRNTYFLTYLHPKTKKIQAVKIGLCSRGPGALERRVQNLRTGALNYDLVVLAEIEGNLEKKMHRKYQHLRMARGEFFKPTKALLKMIADLVEIRRLVSLLDASNSDSRHNE